MKMRVMYSSKNSKVITFAEAISQANGCLANDIPPAYPADKERLVILVLSLKDKPSDIVRRFCMELNPSRTQNVALAIDGPKDGKAEAIIRETLRNAGTNVIEDTYYLPKCGIFSSKITLQERQAIVDWSRKIQEIVSNA